MLIGEFGPGTDGSTGSNGGIGPSPTTTSVQQIVSGAEAYGLGHLQWAWDDNNESGDQTSWAGWFGMTGPARTGYTDGESLECGLSVVADSCKLETIAAGLRLVVSSHRKLTSSR